MKIENNEIVIRNAKGPSLVRAGLFWIVLLYGIIFKDLIAQMKEMWQNKPLYALAFIIIITGLGLFVIYEVLDRRPKLKISKDGLTLNKRKFSWTEISSVEIARGTSHNVLVVHSKNKKPVRLDINDLDADHDKLKRALNVLSGINFFDEEYSQ